MGGPQENNNGIGGHQPEPDTVQDHHQCASKDETDEIVRWILSTSLASSSSSIPSTTTVPVHPSWSNLTKLDLPQCGLSQLPSSFATSLPNLSILFLSSNSFQEMPAVVGACSHLQMVSFKSNGLRWIHPDALQPQLRWLILTDNQIRNIPSTIGRCRKLQKLMLSGNKIESLPEEIANCQKLELVRLGSNELDEPPLQLLRLQSLCWVGLSNNPFLRQVELRPHGELPVLHDLADAVLEGDGNGDNNRSSNIIGQGAGGITRKVLWQDRYVAVKSFAGNMTSDGTPASERNVTLVAATDCSPSECLIELLGVTPPPQQALVMEFLENVHPVSQPPSFASCSRDVYSPSQSLTSLQASAIVSKLLDVMTKLHTAGICHGDFYGHNLLIQANDPSQVKLSDFGAAFFYDRDATYGSLVERVELRAFAVLVEELVQLVPKSERSDCSNLIDLAMACRCESSSFSSIRFTFHDALQG